MIQNANANSRLVDQLVIAYNAHDARAFANFFTADAIHGILHAETQQHGREAIYSRYLQFFADFPENQTVVVHRIAFGAFVVDHEVVRRSPSSEPINVVAIHEFESGLIKRLDFIRE
jgi:uncharacterized protein (TIGR02246 family)